MFIDYTFVVDQMLGRLSKWLRLLGYDSLYSNSIDDSDLVRIAKDEGRILLTRDTRLMKRRAIKNGEIKAVLIKYDNLDDQLEQLSKELNIGKRGEEQLFCAKCNFPIKPIRKADAYKHVPDYVYQTQTEFAKCSHCGRYYWPGTHWARIQEKLSGIF
jgi:uncharacterized protein with PIN domain